LPPPPPPFYCALYPLSVVLARLVTRT